MNTPTKRQHKAHVTRGGQLFWPFIACSLIVLVSACATTQPAGSDVKSRAQERWDALASGDLDAAYAFYSPGYRSSHSRVDFEIDLRTRRVRWTGAKVLEASCEADLCTVKSKVEYKVNQPVPGVPEWKSSENVAERWVRVDGQWWFFPDK
jgi:predicted small secreted protein